MKKEPNILKEYMRKKIYEMRRVARFPSSQKKNFKPPVRKK